MGNSQAARDEFFGAYASGQLDPALELLIETQAALRPETRQDIAAADTLAGFFFEHEKPAPMSFKAVDRALAAIDMLPTSNREAKSAAVKAGQAVDEIIRLPELLRDRVFAAAAGQGWKFAGPGLKVMSLDIESTAEVELLRIEPGCGAPRHTHTGPEYTLVVAGGFTDESGSYGPGDLSIAGPEIEHRPIADAGEVCFALAVREGELEFKGALGFLQKIFA